MHHEEALIGVFAMIGIFGVPIVWIVSHYAFLAWKQWHAVALIRDMIQRGYTPQEMINLLQILGHKKKMKWTQLPDASDIPPAKPVRQPAYSP